MSLINESTIEQSVIETFQSLGYRYVSSSEIDRSKTESILQDRFRSALNRINPKSHPGAIKEAIRKFFAVSSPNIVEDNQRIHSFIADGIDVEYFKDGRSVGEHIKFIDYDNIGNNDFLVSNQFTIIENGHNRRADIVVFINGLPLAVVELKNPVDENATIEDAYNQLQTYKGGVSSLFRCNEVLVISDGMNARVGSLTAEIDRFMPWRTIDGTDLLPTNRYQVDVLIRGLFRRDFFLDFIRNFILFETKKAQIEKKIAGYHQFHAVRKAVQSAVVASSTKGDKRVGVIWHTQGSGKSLSMIFFCRKIVQAQEMKNPTLVILTDRNDLDDQLFETFASHVDFLRQTPIQVSDRYDLREKLKTTAGGIIFTTIQKFSESLEPLSARRNILVIADEAHRSQYDFIDGFARKMRSALPNASFLGFTGTPIEKADRNTPAVFGDYVDVYDIAQAVEDGATVRIYHESRLAKLNMYQEVLSTLDEEFDEITEGEDCQKIRSKWSRLEVLVGDEKRLKVVAHDIVNHYSERSQTINGKAMIVAMSRRICIDLHNEIIALKPEWKENVKIIMTGSASDPPEWQKHIYTKKQRKKLANDFRNPQNPFKIAIVRDMWLTGFDAPCLSVMYLDKPMCGHNLMQAIARVNRVFFDKQSGLIVDYIGLTDNLKKALVNYSKRDRGAAVIDIKQAIDVMNEKFEIVKGIIYGFNYRAILQANSTEKTPLLINMVDFILKQDRGKERFLQAVLELTHAFSICSTTDQAKLIAKDLGLFQDVKSVILKRNSPETKSRNDQEYAIRQLVSKAIERSEIIDILKMAGMESQNVSILSDEFLLEVKGMKQKNFTLELLKKLLNDEIKTKFKRNIVKTRKFSELLKESIARYQNRLIQTVEVVEELLKIAKEIKEAEKDSEKLGLTEEENAFFDALSFNDSAKEVLGDDKLREIARLLTEKIRNSVTIDWQFRESVRAKLRLEVKKILQKYGYPPDLQTEATETVLQQAEAISEGLSCS
jgi:type I restriction enzyme R subunit